MGAGDMGRRETEFERLGWPLKRRDPQPLPSLLVQNDLHLLESPVQDQIGNPHG